MIKFVQIFHLIQTIWFIEFHLFVELLVLLSKSDCTSHIAIDSFGNEASICNVREVVVILVAYYFQVPLECHKICLRKFIDNTLSLFLVVIVLKMSVVIEETMD